MPGRAISWLVHKTRAGHFYAPHGRSETYVLTFPFEGNNLTRDAQMYAFLQRQAEAHPELCLGGPSLSWLYAALREMHALSKRPAPDLPALTFLGTAEKIVTPQAIHRRMSAWPKGRLDVIEGAEHEVLMEGPELRKHCYDSCAALFLAHR